MLRRVVATNIGSAVSVVWAVFGALAAAFGLAGLVCLVDPHMAGTDLVGGEGAGTGFEAPGELGALMRVSAPLGSTLLGLTAAAFCFAVVVAGSARRSSVPDRFAKRWLWRPASFAVGLLALSAWAYNLDEWRSPPRPLDSWGRFMKLVGVLIYGGAALQFIGSALFDGWRRAAEPGPATVGEGQGGG